MQQNSKCRLCGDRNETINHISKCSKLAQEYKTKHDWMGKVIHWDMCKKFQFDHTNKWYMHNPASVLENDTHKLLWNFDIQTDHLIPARRPDLIIINKTKRTCEIVDFAVPADYRIKLKESEKMDKYLNLARELKELWNMRVTIIPIMIDAFGTITKGLLKGLEDLEIRGWVETIQTTTLLRTARIQRESWRPEETCSHSNSSERPSANTDVKNSQGVNNNNNNDNNTTTRRNINTSYLLGKHVPQKLVQKMFSIKQSDKYSSQLILK